MKILALDVDNTIITSINYEQCCVGAPTFFAPVFDPELPALLGRFHDADWKIVLVVSKAEDTHRPHLTHAGIWSYIDAYRPQNIPESTAQKFLQLQAYQEQYDIQNKADVYFFDDTRKHINQAKSAGYVNLFHVTEEWSLADHLRQLLHLPTKKAPRTLRVAAVVPRVFAPVVDGKTAQLAGLEPLQIALKDNTPPAVVPSALAQAEAEAEKKPLITAAREDNFSLPCRCCVIS